MTALPGAERITDWGFATGWLAVRAMPEFAARAVFNAGAAYAARGGGPDQLRRNLARVLGVPPAEVPDELVRASLASYARYWREAFRLPTMDHVKLAARIDAAVVGREHLDAGLAAGRGVVLSLPHSGNWDMCAVWLIQNYGEVTAVVERLKPESLYRRFVAYRESFGVEIVPSSGGDRPPAEVIAERLRQNRVVALMGDRDLSRRGVPVEFFGEPTRMPAGPAKLAIETGATLLPAHCWDDGPADWGCALYPALDTTSGDIPAITQALADVFAANIAAHPADWHMLQPLWLADLAAAHRDALEQN